MLRARALTHQLSDALARSFLRVGVPGNLLQVNPGYGITSPCAVPKFGDYQCSLPVSIYRNMYGQNIKKSKKGQAEGDQCVGKVVPEQLGSAKNNDFPYPKSLEEFGNIIIQELDPESKNLIGSITCAKNGFLNIFIKQEFMEKRVLETIFLNDIPQPTILERDLQILQASKAPTGDSIKFPLPPNSQDGQARDIQALPRTVSIDYSSPNIAKEMHVGHVRSTLLGDALARMLEFSGFNVHRVNHLGDWGTQFGMLIAHMLDLKKLDDNIMSTVSDLQSFYQQAKIRFDTDEEFKARARECVVRLQSGKDDVCTNAWKQICELSQREFRKTYALLGIDPRLKELGESFYNRYLNDVVEELLHLGIAVEKDGAVLIVPSNHNDEHAEISELDEKENGEGSDQPAEIAGAVVIRKKDGGFTYGTTDMAALRFRLLGERWFNSKNIPSSDSLPVTTDLQYDTLGINDWILYVVDAGQSLHFSRIIDAGRRCGWVAEAALQSQKRWHSVLNYHNLESQMLTQPWDARIEHIGFGLVLGENGKRLRTRSGESIKLSALLDESVRRASEAIVAHRSLGDRTKDDPDQLNEDVSELGASIGFGAIKYADLKKNRISDYIFSFDAMLDLKGDTAVYLMYTHARMFSILRRAATSDEAYGQIVRDMLVSQISAQRYKNQGNEQHNSNDFMDVLIQGERNPQRLVAAALLQYAPVIIENSQSESGRESLSMLAPLVKTDPYFTKTGELTEFWFKRQHEMQELDTKLKNLHKLSLDFEFTHPKEVHLLRHLVQFHDTLAASVSHMMPNHLCSYTNELCQRFSQFYRDCHILTSSTTSASSSTGNQSIPESSSHNTKEIVFSVQDKRVLLTHATALTLRRCLQLLGIDTPKRV